jgi:hypothetical protein
MWTPTTREHYNRRATRYQSDLTDEEWRVIEPHLPPPKRTGRPWAWPLREIVNAIFYVNARRDRLASSAIGLSTVEHGLSLVRHMARHLPFRENQTTPSS